ncbi:hypothetical protein QN277_009759 [Acacia crassicarpa]|uniref:Retrotransposon Copia-like N-terminal domain-containing protein n=1 Tax=Acacia crassicarpa TaxID=499986 RepID=A0AAE1M9F6_9FABA|nr:hypothetical protein QN277_009759 [Acacia crassicarpa]
MASNSDAGGSIAGSSSDSSPNLLSPYYLHPNENPSLVLVNPVLTGPNYHTWSRSMRMALQSKNKLAFVDRSILIPSISSPTYSAWLQCNTMVCSWLVRAISPTIAQSILWMDKAYDIWTDLKDRFAQSDIFRVAELQDDMFSFRQGDLSMSDYYTKLKILWDEYVTLRPITRCPCNFTCSCVKYHENDYTLRFLKGLNERFAVVKSQIMLLDPLPSVNRVFSMLLQQEREMPIGIEGASVVLFNKGPPRPLNLSHSNSNSGYNSGRGSGRGSANEKFCTYCNRPRHTVDTCYRKHGFPPGFKFRNQASPSVNHLQSQDPVTSSVLEQSKASDAILPTPPPQFAP